LNGYPYLTSTGTLSPGVDEAGSTPNPGHRYRISIDHTMGGSEAYVSVERDTGAGFVEIIPRFDIFTVNPSQAAVPQNWIVSLTGSTGGARNIHEIGEFEVCAALPIAAYGSPDHYEISHNSPGVTCEGSEVTITAHDASHNLFNVTSDTSITVTTTPAVDNIITSPVTMLSGTSSVSFYINETSVLANIDIDVTDGTASDLDDGGSEDAPFDFLDTAFRFYAGGSNTDSTPIGSQISGKPSNITPGNQNLTLRAVRTNTDTGACEAALQGTTAVDLAYECNNPTTCTASNLLSLTGSSTGNPNRNNNGAVTKNYTSVDMLFDANGEAPFLFNYADAGEITLHARKAVAANDPDPAFELIGQSNPFVVTPFAFHFLVADEPAQTNGAGLTYRKAGEAFDVTLRAVLYESGDNASNNTELANNGLTPNFGSHSSLALELGHSLQAPTGAGTSAGSLQGWSNQSVSFNNTASQGERLFSGLTWSEVGIISMNAGHSNYLGSGQTISGARPNIGRFYPDHFDVTVNSGGFDASCGNFTYIGQDFTYDSLQVPSLTITAKNSIGSGGTTVNYTDTNFMKLDALGITRVFPLTDTSQSGSDNITLMSVATDLLAGTGEALIVDGAGVMTYSFDAADLYRYTKNANAEIGPFDSSLSIAVTEIRDADDVLNGALISDVTPSASGSANESHRYGRFVMQNAFGPETDDLAMEAYAEFLSAPPDSQYRLNTADSCTNLVSTLTLNPTGASGTENHDSIPVGSGTSDFSYSSPLSSGDAGFLFTAPGAGNDGTVDVNVDLLAFPWLQYDWNGDGALQNPPSATASFGQYRGHDRIIYWRELQ
jgi:MSHA biogenesis protein MshQ